MHPKYAFVIALADEGSAQLESCLGFLRAAYPDAPVIVISDGVSDPAHVVACKRHKAKYVQGAYLKRIECGGKWWERALKVGLATGADWLVKIDPDTRVLRPFRFAPPHPISGTLTSAGTNLEHIQGGCQAIRRDAASRILASKLLRNEVLRDCRTFSRTDADYRRLKAISYCSTDHSLAWACRNLGIAMGDWTEVASRWKPPAPTGDFAVTHPHKLEAAPAFLSAPLRVITTCKGRLTHLKRTLPTWLAEPNVSATVVDYNCPEGTTDWIRENYPSVDVVHVRDATRFHLARARNIGAAHSPAGWWCFWDADMLAAPGWASAVRSSLRRRHYLMPDPIEWEQYGSVVVHSDDFKAVGGYDELFQGWGGEDGDFYTRLRHVGVRPSSYNGSYVATITHSDADRTRHYVTKDKRESQRLYERYRWHKTTFMLATGRLPDAGECRNFLAEAVGKVRPSSWYFEIEEEEVKDIVFYRARDERERVVEDAVTRSPTTPDESPTMLAPLAGSAPKPLQTPDANQGSFRQVSAMRASSARGGAPVINVAVTIQNVGQDACTQQQPETFAAVN